MIIIIIITILLIISTSYAIKIITPQPQIIPTPQIIWLYWENKPNTPKPEYINLCYETIQYHCNKDFEIILLNETTIYDYLPNLRKDINKLLIAQKTDYIRVALLHKYGGIWIDSDTIVMKNLIPIINKINKGYDYVGFGCSDKYCFNGYGKPSNGVMCSKPNGILMKNVLQELDGMLDNNDKFKYFDLGKFTIWNTIKKLDNYDYYHYNASYDGSRDIYGGWINVDNHISTTPTTLLNEHNVMFVFLENNKFMGKNPKYNFFSKLSSDDIMNGDYWICDLFRKSLNQ